MFTAIFRCSEVQQACRNAATAEVLVDFQQVSEEPLDYYSSPFQERYDFSQRHDEIETPPSPVNFSFEQLAVVTPRIAEDDYDPANPVFIESVPKEIAQAMQQELLLKQIAALEKAVSLNNDSDESPMVREHYEHVLHELHSELLALRGQRVADTWKDLRSIVSASTNASDSPTSSLASENEFDGLIHSPVVSTPTRAMIRRYG